MTDTPAETQTNGGASSPEDAHRLELQRRENAKAIAELGLDVYGSREAELIDLAAAHARYDENADQRHQASVAEAKASGAEGSAGPTVVDERPRVKVAGRVVLKRPTGKLVWLNIRDHSRGSFQIAISKADCEERGFALAKLLDLGDQIIAEGPLMRTRAGEVTCWASTIRMGAKSLTPPPEKHAGLTDIETRYRQRYIDLWASPETMRVFRLRSAIVSSLRHRLEQAGFAEVETPMLQVQAGGAAARPFLTHMNALDIELSLRIAPELFLKRLLVGGMPRVFEINRNFRNEGLDKQHNPEFTMLELYEAYGNCQSVMTITEELVREAAKVAVRYRAGEEGVDAASLSVPGAMGVVRYSDPFDRVTYRELFVRELGFEPTDGPMVRAEAAKRNIEIKDKAGAPIDTLLIANELFEDVAEPTLDPCRPTWITEYPARLSPLTRDKPDDPSIAERADLFIGGMEIGPHYTELNDPDTQAERFRDQLAGIDDEESTFRTYDEDFVNALKVGMPPAGGLGLGIDRLVMLMAGQAAIRDVVLFPMMRPKRSTTSAVETPTDQ